MPCKKHVNKQLKCANLRACRKTQHLEWLHITECMKYSVFFFPFFDMCSFPFRTCRSAKKYGGKREGETESMRAKAEQAAGKRARASQELTGRRRERERERAKERLKT